MFVVKIEKKFSKIHIGTSGWSYDHWQEVFYPKDLLKTKWFSDYYVKFFQTVEINSSFYHLPKKSTFENWSKKTPKDFLFSVKAPRYITHIQKLNNPRESLERFFEAVKGLGKKLEPILFQLPPGLKVNSKRLNQFLIEVDTIFRKKDLSRLKLVFEFRHSSWFCSEIYQILKKHRVCLCFADTPFYPYQEEIITNFLYLRLHGRKELYASNYSSKELKNWAKKIKNWTQKNLEVFLYFDNDTKGYAIKNALEIKRYLL